MTEREALAALQAIVGTYEVNTIMARTPAGAMYLSACQVPGAAEIRCPDGRGYEAWRKGRVVMRDLEIGDAANIVVMDYMTAKVQRAKRLNPALREYADDVLLAHLLKGYQSAQQVAS